MKAKLLLFFGFIICLIAIFSFRYISHNTSIQNIQTTSNIIEAKTGSFNDDGKIDTIQLVLLNKYDEYSKNQKPNGRLGLIQDGKVIDSKNVMLENNNGTLALVRLFGKSKQQILFTTGVGAHSEYGFIYQLKNNKLNSICPDDNNGDSKRGVDCFFFSDDPNIYAEDLDGDGIDEIIASGHAYYDSQTPITVYKWNGSKYKTYKDTSILNINDIPECNSFRCPVYSDFTVDNDKSLTDESVVIVPTAMTDGAGKLEIIKNGKVIFDSGEYPEISVKRVDDGDGFILSYAADLETRKIVSVRYRYKNGKFVPDSKLE